MAKISVKEILRSVGMCSEIEYYLNAPASQRFLDGETLFKIYLKIEEELGKEKAKTFADMVRILEPLSAVNFLYSFYLLEEVNWDIALFGYRSSFPKIKGDFLRKFEEEKDPKERVLVCSNNDSDKSVKEKINLRRNAALRYVFDR